ncbi:hypothetical protein CONPUDRAFT_166767 [Coniophora puteana RWD-64-598 SS2]|uniref:Uncharacterized protein n=1 Tax=Coniophora puteana (strain RWD-64-598) TaxID=741705 RepID=A0A5M3MIZ1_CONPW|nr:uncharacterized protein CONPUDRAFT_166767 [Coniophora puteana RWD-64-598 SS2]EIW78890.1 hypothetical protein CONPUDRAFT_166767 [Coniophora puteana RWD-64-598 SS2]
MPRELPPVNGNDDRVKQGLYKLCSCDRCCAKNHGQPLYVAVSTYYVHNPTNARTSGLPQAAKDALRAMHQVFPRASEPVAGPSTGPGRS